MRIPAITIIFLFIFTILIDLYIAGDIKRLIKKKWATTAYIIFSILCIAFLIVTICLPRRDENSQLGAVMWMLYVFLSVYIWKAIYIIFSCIALIYRIIIKPRKPFYLFYWFGIGTGAIFFIIMWIGVIYTRKEIKEEHIVIKSKLLPKSFDGYKIAQISDLHVGTWGSDTTFISELVDKVNSIKADMIVFTGDLVNRHTPEIEPFLSILGRLKAKDGVYSVLGNHDYGDYIDWEKPSDREENNRLLAEYQKEMGWTLLNNEKIFISNGKDSIILIGVENWGDPPFPTYGDLEKSLSSSTDSIFNQNDSNFKILLSHNPEHWNRIISKDTNIALTLSGHTHAMQLMLKIGDWKWSASKYRYEQWGGKFDRLNKRGENTTLYVNIGAGEVGMPVRLLDAYPEISVLTLKKE